MAKLRKVSTQEEHSQGSEQTKAAPAGYSPEPAEHIPMSVLGCTAAPLLDLLSVLSRAQCRVKRPPMTSFLNGVERKCKLWHI